MFTIFWNSLDTLKDIVISLTGWDINNQLLPTTIVNNKIKCLDYDMDNVVFQHNNKYKKNILYEIHTQVKHDLEVLNNI